MNKPQRDVLQLLAATAAIGHTFDGFAPIGRSQYSRKPVKIELTQADKDRLAAAEHKRQAKAQKRLKAQS